MRPRLAPCWTAFCVACCAALAVSACSAVSFGYRHAPTLVSWRAADRFELDAAQRTALRERLQAVQAWHRDEQLAPLVHTLEEAGRRLEGPVTAADGEWLAESLLVQYRLVVGRVVDASADLAASLRPEQIAALEAHLEERAAEFDETWIDASAEEVRRTRFERIRDRAEDWLGSLEPEQRRWLQARLDAIPVDYRLWREERRRRESAFVALLAEVSAQPDLDVDPAALRRWALDWDGGRSDALQREAERLRREYIALGVELANMATPAQRERARARLADYAAALSAHLP